MRPRIKPCIVKFERILFNLTGVELPALRKEWKRYAAHMQRLLDIERNKEALDMYALGCISEEDLEFILDRPVSSLSEEERDYIASVERDYDEWLTQQRLAEDARFEEEMFNNINCN